MKISGNVSHSLTFHGYGLIRINILGDLRAALSQIYWMSIRWVLF